MIGGLTFGVVKPILAKVTENGICEDDARVMARTSEAIKALLDEVIPVGGMATFDVQADGDTILLPKELENAIEVEVLTGDVRDKTDVKQGWYDLVNPFTYVHPNAAHDNPLIDQFLVPDPNDPTILRRQYKYPGLSNNAVVRVTGAKRFLPIVSDADYLIIQNLWAIKLMIMAIERLENGALDQWKVMKDEAIGVLNAEVKKHLLDPSNVMKRKAAYDADLVTFQTGTHGYVRALMAHMLPSGLLMGKSELSRVIDMAEMRLMNKGQWVGTLETFEATVEDGCIALPTRVQSIVAAEMCGQSLDIRHILYEYQQNSCFSTCEAVLHDQGEKRFGEKMRRVYHLIGARNEGETLRFVAKLRWTKKNPDERMTIQNQEALRLMGMAVLLEESGKMAEAQGPAQMALTEVERELREYLAGIKMHMTVITDEADSRRIGGVM